MSYYRKPARRAASTTRSTLIASTVIVGAAIIALAASPIDILHGNPKAAVIGDDSDEPTTVVGIDSNQPTAVIDIDTDSPTMEAPGQLDDHDRRDLPGQAMLLGEADGVVPDGVIVTVFDDIPAVANLDPDLLDAFREAGTDAADDGVEFYVNSGWRSSEYQDQLLREAIATYGSEEEAARWVAAADTSPHVSGDAVDIGPSDAATWLSAHGAEYGLCQIYSNEPWHFELRSEAIVDGCPTMYADPTQDPRMQR